MNNNFAAFIAPAQDRKEIWRIFATLVCFGVLYLVGSGVMLTVGLQMLGHEGGITADFLFDTPQLMLLLLTSFIVWIVAMLIAIYAFHRRGLISLIGAGWARFLKGFFLGGFIFGLISAVLAGFFPEAEEIVENLPYQTWIKFLGIGVFLMFIQVSAEELLFRGYLQQQLAARFQSRILFLGLPSLLFGLGHFSMQNGLAVGLMIVGLTTLLGLVLADLTYRFGSLGPAIGIHFLNNFSAMFLVSFQEEASGLARYVIPAYFGNPELLAETLRIQLVVFALAALAYFIFMEWRIRFRLQST